MANFEMNTASISNRNVYIASAALYGLAPMLWTAKKPFCPH